MSYVSNFEKLTGKKVNCYGLTKDYLNKNNINPFGENLVAHFDTATFPTLFKKVDWDISAVGLCIEPMTTEQLEQARKGVIVKSNQSDFNDNTVCLLFNDIESIDKILETLKKCRTRLDIKIKQRKWEEYRAKYYGEVVKFEDLLRLKGGVNHAQA